MSIGLNLLCRLFDFKTDKSIENKLLLTAAPDGYLKRI
ncbi:MAG TPA: hypothetical protein EYQ26_15795 [Rhodospirillales bacterium]|nr:hypothetical protein [Rhodospirillales bacterium]HIL74728.1 hypothetical protein [Rhodospirillales bacterium]